MIATSPPSLDYSLPLINGVELTRQVLRRLPGADGYSRPHEIRCNVFLQSNTLRPRIVLAIVGPPTCIEQQASQASTPGQHHFGTAGEIISECAGDFVAICS